MTFNLDCCLYVNIVPLCSLSPELLNHFLIWLVAMLSATMSALLFGYIEGNLSVYLLIGYGLEDSSVYSTGLLRLEQHAQWSVR